MCIQPFKHIRSNLGNCHAKLDNIAFRWHIFISDQCILKCFFTLLEIVNVLSRA